MTNEANSPFSNRNQHEAAERSQAANIADEQAAYAAADGSKDARSLPHAEGVPQTGEEAPLAEGSTDEPPAGAAEFSRSEGGDPDRAGLPTQGESDSVEPGRIPGSAEDIHVDGVTGPGPSG